MKAFQIHTGISVYLYSAVAFNKMQEAAKYKVLMIPAFINYQIK